MRHKAFESKGRGWGQIMGRSAMLLVVGSLTALVCGLVVLNIALTIMPKEHGLRAWANCVAGAADAAGCKG